MLMHGQKESGNIRDDFSAYMWHKINWGNTEPMMVNNVPPRYHKWIIKSIVGVCVCVCYII